MRARALLAAMLLVPVFAHGQVQLAPDLSFGAGADGSRFAVALLHRFGDDQGRFWVGLGGRATAYSGDPVAFTQRSDEPGSFDTDVIIDPAVYGLNLFGEAGIRLGDRLAFGFNLDLIGVATGPDRSTAAGVTSPAVLSLFLYGNNDRGALNSELFGQARLTRTVHLRVGLSHYVLGYESAGNGGFDATRFQRFHDAVFVAVRLGG